MGSMILSSIIFGVATQSSKADRSMSRDEQLGLTAIITPEVVILTNIRDSRFDSTFIRLLFDFNKGESNKTRIESASYSTIVESNTFNIRFEKIEPNTNKGHIRFDSAVEKHYPEVTFSLVVEAMSSEESTRPTTWLVTGGRVYVAILSCIRDLSRTSYSYIHHLTGNLLQDPAAFMHGPSCNIFQSTSSWTFDFTYASSIEPSQSILSRT
jgi:hypothetical protein